MRVTLTGGLIDMKDYRYENVVCKGKRYSFNVKKCKNFNDSKNKAVNWMINVLSLPKNEFANQLEYLSKNIESGETKVIPINNQQLDLDLSSKSSKFDKTFERIYSGLLKEDEISQR